MKHLKLPKVTLAVTPTLFISFASLSLCRFSDVFSSSLTHATINLQTPSSTALYQTPGSRRRTQTPKDPLPRSPSILSPPPPGLRYCPAFSSSLDMTLMGNLWSPMWSSAPSHNNFLLLQYIPIKFTGGCLCRRGCGHSTTCTRLLGFQTISAIRGLL